jgi:transposase
MALVNPRLSVYQIRRQHRNEEVRELIPANFAGVMICDRGKSYDAEELNEIEQQKCLAHLMRNAVEVAEAKTGRARQFSQKLKELLKQTLTLPEKNRTSAGTLPAAGNRTGSENHSPPAKQNPS